MERIAILITCYNRKDKTLKCLSEIYANYNKNLYSFEIFIVDGGSSDNTPSFIKEKFPEVHLKICNGLFWAEGMREAWKLSETYGIFDYFLLLNDDTNLYPIAIDELIKADKYSLETKGKSGIYVGSTCDPETKKYTYGGIKLKQWGKRAGTILVPNGTYQQCDLANANILMISRTVYNVLGSFSNEYTHGIADFDYSLSAVKAGFPVWVLPFYCGECQNDHGPSWLPQGSTLKQRIKYLYSPKGLAYKQQLHYIRKFFPSEYNEMKIKLWLKTLFPFIWTYLKK